MVKATLDAEYSVIGCLLVDPSIAGELLYRTRPEDFTVPELRTVYNAAVKLFGAGRPVDAVTIRGLCGAEYNDLLMQCMDITPTSFGWRTVRCGSLWLHPFAGRQPLAAGLRRTCGRNCLCRVHCCQRRGTCGNAGRTAQAQTIKPFYLLGFSPFFSQKTCLSCKSMV